MKKAEIDAVSALGAYLGMECRSLRRLVRELASRNIPVSLWTLKRWSVRHDWQARAGVRIGRLAMGEATSRSEVTWNAFILPVLTVFKETVCPSYRRRSGTR